uniref:Uncharacterized protein n=1 Tax=Candidatus Nitrotoga fabula TaxID=2182327 RepID=A0A2X0QWI6_9PROT|nr:protein of unknown function [Candidatus Nitrotoga fabula]
MLALYWLEVSIYCLKSKIHLLLEHEEYPRSLYISPYYNDTGAHNANLHP